MFKSDPSKGVEAERFQFGNLPASHSLIQKMDDGRGQFAQIMGLPTDKERGMVKIRCLIDFNWGFLRHHHPLS